MKATIKITTMLMAMTIGTLAASAQSARRGTPHSEDNRKTSQMASTKSSTVESRQVGNNNKSTRPHVNSNATPARVQSDRGNAGNKSTAQTPQRTTAVKNSNQKTSTTNHYNPRSNYKAPNRTVHVGKTHLDPKRSNNVNNSNSNASHRTVKTKHYNTPANHVHNHVYYPKKSVKIHVHPSTYHNHYRAMYYPAHRDIIWTGRMNRYYIGLYPGYNWRYPMGYHIQTMSVFDARYNIGEVARVYGRVYATWFNKETDDLLLFFGGEFPHQEFTMVIPGNIARRHSWRPERYFLGQHIFATGLITTYDGSPEMIIKKKNQLDVY